MLGDGIAGEGIAGEGAVVPKMPGSRSPKEGVTVRADGGIGPFEDTVDWGVGGSTGTGFVSGFCFLILPILDTLSARSAARVACSSFDGGSGDESTTRRRLGAGGAGAAGVFAWEEDRDPASCDERSSNNESSDAVSERFLCEEGPACDEGPASADTGKGPE